MSRSKTESFTIPGTSEKLVYTRDEKERLTGLFCNERTYLYCSGSVYHYDEDIAIVDEILCGQGLLRSVKTIHGSWVEKYLWDKNGRPYHIDGTEIIRDKDNRITLCRTNKGDWQYTYQGHNCVRIDSPLGTRHIAHDLIGRPVKMQENDLVEHISYDANNKRKDIPQLPETWHRDNLGRLWTVKDKSGNILFTWLWDGFRCIGRINGKPGQKLFALFCTDPGGTPTRIITRQNAEQIPRDACGESLLYQNGVPGLFGGCIYKGFMHYRSRILDVRTASYNAPDPFDGSQNDPRRKEGYQGTLAVDAQPAGVYALCYNDPVTYADPTGEVNGWMVLSDLTWSLQNNIVGWLGFEPVINLWGSIFAGKTKEFGESKYIESERTGSFGTIRNGCIANERAKTFQHMILGQVEEFLKLEDAHVFVPDTRFTPTLCGTLLHCIPDHGTQFLLRGSRNPGNVDTAERARGWTRSGGAAEQVIPFSPVPWFPEGGLHFDGPILGLRKGEDDDNFPCRCTEIEPFGPVGMGTISNRSLIIVPTAPIPVVDSDFILITDAQLRAFITTAVSEAQVNGQTHIVLEHDLTGIVDQAGLDLQRLGAPIAPADVFAAPVSDTEFDAIGSTGAYVRSEPVRLIQNNETVGATFISRFTAQIAIDEELPDTMVQPLTVTTLEPGPDGAQGAECTADVNKLHFEAADPKPATGEIIIVTGNGNTIVTIVTGVEGDDRVVDRELGDVGGDGDPVTWEKYQETELVGTRNEDVEANPQITYEANDVRKAPSTGYVLIDDASGNQATRTVTGLNYDRIEVSPPLAGDTTQQYEAERFSGLPAAQQFTGSDCSFTVENLLDLNSDPDLENTKAFLLHRINGTALQTPIGAALTDISGLNVANAANAAGNWLATATMGAGWVVPGDFSAGQIAVIDDNADFAPVCIKSISMSFQFDRLLELNTSGLSIVPLEPDGPAYNAVFADAVTVTALPYVDIGGIDTRVQMPRFVEGEMVEITWNAAGAPVSMAYRIVSIDGTTMTVDGQGNLPAPAVLNGTIRRLIPVDPATGSPIAGIKGQTVNGNPIAGTGKEDADTVSFNIWENAPFAAHNYFAIVDEQAAFPVSFDNTHTPDLEIEFGDDPGIYGNACRITAPQNCDETRYCASFTTEAQTIRIMAFDPPEAGSFGGNPDDCILAMAFRDTLTQTEGELSGGTTYVPQDIGYELTRYEALRDHELIHTRQCTQWGPLLVAFFPVWLLEMILELTTDIEEPEFSPYVGGEIVRSNGIRVLHIPDFQGIDFEEGDSVQVTNGGAQVVMELGDPLAEDERKFRITNTTLSGNVQLRRCIGTGAKTAQWFVNIIQLFTHGSVMNNLVGATYGGIFYGLYRLIYAAVRGIGGSGDVYQAEVENDGAQIRLYNEADTVHFSGAARIIVQSGESSLVRSVGRPAPEEGEEALPEPDPAVIFVRTPLSFTGTVQVAPYSTHTPGSCWDSNSYYPATIADTNRPAAIQVFAVGDDSLTLARHDRVVVTSGTQSIRTNVSNVTSDGIVELEDIPPLPTGETNFRIAKIGTHDPMGWLDSWLIDEMELGWTEILFDPWGRLNLSIDMERGSFWDVLTRIGRYLFGTQSYSLLPALGYFFWDNAFKQSAGEGFLSEMEQEASEESGDLYSPLGRLHNYTRRRLPSVPPGQPEDFSREVDDDEDPNFPYVGDIGRYWFFPWKFGTTEPSGYVIEGRHGMTVITEGLQDAPGTHINNIDSARLLPSVTDTAAASADPNGAAETPAGTGLEVADIFVQKNAADPLNPLTTAIDPVSFTLSNQGRIPLPPRLERVTGAYIAFCRPSNDQNLITVPNDIDMADRVVRTSDGLQRTFYRVTVHDVTVSVFGNPIENDQTLTLFATQRVHINVEPTGNRSYAITLPEGNGGNILHSNGEDEITAQTTLSTDPVPVEISRIYRYDNGAFVDEALTAHGVNAFSDIHIPVRMIDVEVTDELLLRSGIPSVSDLFSNWEINKVDELRPGNSGFYLVPVPCITVFTTAFNYNPVAPPADHVDPVVNPDPDVEIEPAMQAYIGDGGIFEVNLGANDPPEEEVDVTFSIDVGEVDDNPDPANPPVTTTLTSTIKLKPHFRLTAPSYDVAAGDTITLTLTTEPGDPAVTAGSVVVTPSADVEFEIVTPSTVDITFDSADAGAIRRVLVTDGNDENRIARRTIRIV
ncbi:MAG: hypothetical protein KKC46_14135 [Proteobacteria bacterium]|nr:hypothetical protein [Pseudomonadota bacterium]